MAPHPDDCHLSASVSQPTTNKKLSKGEADAILRNQQHSPLLRLPAEVRNHIYSYVFSAYHILVDLDGAEPPSPHAEVVSFNGEKSPLSALLDTTRICRQVFAESHLLPFKLNDVVLGDTAFLSYIMRHFSHTEREAIRLLSIGDMEGMMGPENAPADLLHDFPCLDIMGVKRVEMSTEHWEFDDIRLDSRSYWCVKCQKKHVDLFNGLNWTDGLFHGRFSLANGLFREADVAEWSSVSFDFWKEWVDRNNT
ncbi:hypothetical protein NX059_003713 [Plenodomus lindquistii]|nr:hypothetical protein NX059_003713 [Plenodomus lindquistii]